MPVTRSQNSVAEPGRSSSPYPLLCRVKKVVEELGSGEEAVLLDVDRNHALQVIASVEAQRTNQEVSLRASYNSVVEDLLLRPIPTQLHDSVQAWHLREIALMVQAGWLTGAEFDILETVVGTDFSGFQAPYAGSLKQPDMAWRVLGEPFPSITVEVGWTESYPKLVRDIDVWMTGSGGATCICIIVEFNRRANNRIAAFYQVFRQNPGAAGGYIAEPIQDIFPVPVAQPQVISITRGDLFGPRLVPGRNAADLWDLDIARFRQLADLKARLDGYVPL